VSAEAIQTDLVPAAVGSSYRKQAGTWSQTGVEDQECVGRWVPIHIATMQITLVLATVGSSRAEYRCGFGPKREPIHMQHTEFDLFMLT